MQLLPSRERGLRGRFPEAFDALGGPAPALSWIEHALGDLLSPEQSRFRTFLRSVGSDVTNGRELFAQFAELHHCLQDLGSGDNAVIQATRLASSEPMPATARMAVAVAAMHVKTLPVEAIEFVLAQLDHMTSGETAQNGPRLAHQLWRIAPASFVKLLESNESAASFAEVMLREASPTELIAGIQKDDTTLRSIVRRRSDLLEQPNFWRLGDAATQLGLAQLDGDSMRVDAAIRAMMNAERSDLAPLVARKHGSTRIMPQVAAALAAASEERLPAHLAGWFEVASKDTWTLAKLLSQVAFRTRPSLVVVARGTTPDTIPNDYGEDPWWTAFRVVVAPASQDGEEFLCAYLLARALGYRSRNRGEILAATFNTVYKAASRPDMAEESWRLLAQRLPSRWGIPDWDKCPRLRLGVVEAFVDHELSPIKFWHLTPDEMVFSQLIDIAADSYRGRRFLRRVHRDLSDQERRSNAHRVAILERSLD